MRRGSGFGDPLEAIDAEKRRRVTRAAESFLARHPELAGAHVSLEAVAVRGRRIARAPM
jgi:Holliday junction resolvase-like predicted endonuclease